MDDHQLVDECRNRLAGRCEILAVLVNREGTTGLHPSIKLIAIVNDDQLRRARWSLPEALVDVFVGTSARLIGELEGGYQYHLASVISSARCVFGDNAIARKLGDIARSVVRQPAPPPSPNAVFRFKCQPFDLLRIFASLTNRDAVTSKIVVATLVQTCIEGYLLLNRLSLRRIDNVIEIIENGDARAAEAIRRVVDAPVEVLHKHQKLLEEMVLIIFGKESEPDDLFVAAPAAKAWHQVVSETSIHRPVPTTRKGRTRESNALLSYKQQSPNQRSDSQEVIC